MRGLGRVRGLGRGERSRVGEEVWGGVRVWVVVTRSEHIWVVWGGVMERFRG